MKCQRCGSMLIDDGHYTVGEVWEGYRCPTCGDRVDERILRVRLAQARPKRQAEARV
ncbi:MAG: hypothetical protein ABIJ57_01390 [Pseudomonadota bacterium]